MTKVIHITKTANKQIQVKLDALTLGAACSYGMFSVEGNQAVRTIITNGIESGSNWRDVYTQLEQLAASDPTRFAEATDTSVREQVYDACNFTTKFYLAY